MKAVIANGPKDYKIVTDKPIPTIQEGQVLVKVLANGICGSDLKMYEGSEFYWGPGGRAKRGVIPGHEFIGSVVDIDPIVARDQSISVGDIVVAEQLVACRSQCWFCKNDMEHKCDKLAIYGQAIDGSMAEYMIYQKGSWLHKVPKDLSPTYAVLAEPLAVSIHAIDRANLKPTDLVVVSGCGTIGLGLIAALGVYYPDVSIIVLDYFQFKLDLAKSIVKKCITFNLSDKTISSIADGIRKISGERSGADVFFECSGSPDSIRAGFEFIRKCGTFVHIGICKEISVTAPWNVISAGKELIIIGCNLGRKAWPRAFEILQKCDLSPMITHVLPLEEYANAFGLLGVGIKIILDPTLAPTNTPNSASLLAPAVNGERKVFEIKDSVALVTGSSRGIGSAIAIALAREGAKVIIHGRSHDSPSSLNEGTTMTTLAQEISTMTNNMHITPTWGDLSTREGVQSVLSRIKYPIDILICCAGGRIASSGDDQQHKDTCLTINDADVSSVLSGNLSTTHLVCQLVVPQMVRNHHGRVVMIGSTWALMGREKDAVYTVSKAAVHQYMRCLAKEVQSSGVRVNCIAPGQILTEGSKHNMKKTEQDMTGEPEHVANAVVQLLKMDFVHGEVIRVDGGEQNCC